MRMFSALLALGAIGAIGACSGSPAPGTAVPLERAPAPDPTVPLPAGTPRAKLVVLLVIDQLPQWSLVAKWPALQQGGFTRLASQGDWFTGEHPSATTVTAPGHALLGTGEPTWRSGIVGNEWWDRGADRVVRAAEALDGTIAATWLRVPGLGDAVAAANTGAKAASVALKDRAALMQLGHAGTAIYYEADTASWHATTPAPWLAAYDRAHPVKARLGEPWTPSRDAQAMAALTNTVDDAPGERGEKGFGATFPHLATATKQPADAIYAMPLGNELTLAMALAAIDGEGLGTDATPDLLAVSLSSHDYMGHGWGHESWEAWDMLLRLDAALATFFAALDAKVGRDGWAIVVTSDHGASPAPAAHGGGAITYGSLQDAANRAASTVLGAGAWIAYVKYPSLYLSAAARGKPAKDRRRALVKIAYAVRSYPGIERAELTSDFAGHCDRRTGDAHLFCLSLDAERTGDVFFLPRPHWIFEDHAGRFATAHGSRHPHDREVPLFVLPPGSAVRPRARAAAPTQRISMTQVAPILAGYLGVPSPTTLPR